MFTPKGRKTVRIKKYNDLQITCENCGHKKHRFSVMQEFYFMYFIPIYASNQKIVKCECLHCGYRMNSKKKDHYLSKTRTPFYFYSAFIIVALIFLSGIVWSIYKDYKDKEYVENPEIGDVYLIIDKRNEKDIYLYVKLKELKGDSLVLLHNNVKYSHFVTKMNDSDYFSIDGNVTIHKNTMKHLLDENQLNTVERDYDHDNKFNIDK
jgi:hypothetical protein